MLPQKAPEKKNDPAFIINKTVGTLPDLCATGQVKPVLIEGHLLVGCYKDEKNFYIGVFDLLNRNPLITLDFGNHPPSFPNRNIGIRPMTKTNHFVIVYESGSQIILKRWNNKTFKCDNTLILSDNTKNDFIDAENMVVLEGRLFFYRCCKDFFGKLEYSFCTQDPSLSTVQFDTLMTFDFTYRRQIFSPLHILGKNGLIACEFPLEIIVLDTHSREVCARYPRAREDKITASTHDEQFCIFNPSKDTFTLVTMSAQKGGVQRHCSGQTVYLPGNGNQLQKLYWSPDNFLIAQTLSSQSSQLQIIRFQQNQEGPALTPFAMAQVIESFSSCHPLYFGERIVVFVSPNNPKFAGHADSFQTYSLMDKQQLQTLSTTVSQSIAGQVFPKGICDLIASYGYGRMSSSASTPEEKPAQNQSVACLRA